MSVQDGATTFWDTTFPSLLSQLHTLEFDYADGEGIDFEPYSAFLSYDETNAWLKAWTGNKEANASQLRVFGQDGTGGYAAFWLNDPNRSILEQPVVFLGSEGETGVVAANFHDYLWLLASGLGPYEVVAYPDLIREPNTPFLRFAEQHSSSGPMQVADVLSKAQQAFPSFAEHLQSLCR